MNYIYKFLSLLILFILISFFIFRNYVLADEITNNDDQELNITSPSAILIDSNTGKVLFEKNSGEIRSIASLTKILTAIITIEKCDLNDKAQASYYATHSLPSGYSIADIKENEEFTISELLDVLLVHSANDAAIVLAEHISNTEDEFANLMNEYARNIGCTNSNFVNSNGKEDQNHYSTAKDMALIMRYCMKNETFREIASKQYAKLSSTDIAGERTFQTTVKILLKPTENTTNPYYYPYIIAGKTGFTTQAQNCLVSAAKKDDLELISVILGSGKTQTGESIRFYETKDIYEYGFNNFKTLRFKNANEIVDNISISNTNFDVYTKDNIDVLLNKDPDKNTMKKTISLDKTTLPISKDEKVGKITFLINDVPYDIDVYSASDIALEKSQVTTNDNVFSTFIKQNEKIAYIFVGSSIVIFLFLLIILSKKNSRQTSYIPYDNTNSDLKLANQAQPIEKVLNNAISMENPKEENILDKKLSNKKIANLTPNLVSKNFDKIQNSYLKQMIYKQTSDKKLVKINPKHLSESDIYDNQDDLDEKPRKLNQVLSFGQCKNIKKIDNTNTNKKLQNYQDVNNQDFSDQVSNKIFDNKTIKINDIKTNDKDNNDNIISNNLNNPFEIDPKKSIIDSSIDLVSSINQLDKKKKPKQSFEANAPIENTITAISTKTKTNKKSQTKQSFDDDLDNDNESEEIQIDIEKIQENRKKNLEAINAIKQLKNIQNQNTLKKKEQEALEKKKQLNKLKEKIAIENTSEQLKDIQFDEDYPSKPRKTRKQINTLKKSNIKDNSDLIDMIKSKKSDK